MMNCPERQMQVYKGARRAGLKVESFTRKLRARPASHVIGLKRGAHYMQEALGSIVVLEFVKHWGRASKFRILGRNSTQAIYLPQSCIRVTQGNSLAPADWFWRKPNNLHKLKLASL